MNHFTLRRFIHNKRALGAPVGNLIILVAAVVLSTTVVLFAVNVTSNQVQKESLFIAGTTLTMEEARISIENTGPTAIRVAQVTIKGDRFANYTTDPPEVKTEGLPKGNSTVIIVDLTVMNGTLTVNDVGRPVTVIVATTQGSYFTETLVQATKQT